MGRDVEEEPTGADLLRRGLLAAGALTPWLAAAAAPAWALEAAPPAHLEDFDFLVGRWRMRHHRLKDRLVGSNLWQDFNGTLANQKLMGGQANIDDCVFELPAGTYRGLGLRLFDPGRRTWSIYWVDARTTRIDPPVVGGFEGGRGVFYGEDVEKGRPVKVRFYWFVDGPDRLRWEQAFSTDGGATWEVNWRQELERES